MTAQRHFGAALLLTLLTTLPAAAQKPKLEPGSAHPTIPTVTFTLDWPTAKPPYFSIAVDSAGRAAYSSVDDKKSKGDPYMLKFTVSGPVRERIFADAEALQYFKGPYEFKRHKVAFTGNKTLAYDGPEHRSRATFNWSQDTRVMGLTQMFLAIGNTVEGGRRLEYLRRYDHLGLNDELKELEAEAKDHYLAEVHIIEPLLRQIANDPQVMDLARQRAFRLLRLAAAENAASGATR